MKLPHYVVSLLLITVIAAFAGCMSSESSDRRTDGNNQGNQDSKNTKGKLSEDLLPSGPVVSSNTPTRIRRPKWTWVASTEAYKSFQYRLVSNNKDAIAWSATSETFFQPAHDLPDGLHILFVREKVDKNRWSKETSFPVIIDATPPRKPVVTAPSVTNNRTPQFRWTSGGGGGSGRFRLNIDNVDLSSFAVETTKTSYEPDAPLSPGVHVFYISEVDKLGNESEVLSFSFTVDVDAEVAALSDYPTGISAERALRIKVANDHGVTSYRYKIGIEASTNCSEISTYSQVVPVMNLISDDISALGDTSIKLCVLAIDSAGNVQSTQSPTEITWVRDTTAPVLPQTFITEGVAETVMKWKWTSDPDVSGLMVLRSNSASSWQPESGKTYPLGTIPSGETIVALLDHQVDFYTGFSDTGLTNGTNYFYKVFAFDNARNYSLPHSHKVRPFSLPTLLANGGFLLSGIDNLVSSGNSAIAINHSTKTAYALDVSALPQITVKSTLNIDLGFNGSDKGWPGRNELAFNGKLLLAISGSDTVSTLDDYLEVYDFSDLAAPIHRGTLTLSGISKSVVFASNSIAYLGVGCGGMSVISLDDPASPTIVRTALPYDRYSQHCVQSIDIEGNRAVVATENSISIFNIADPGNPLLLTLNEPTQSSPLSTTQRQVIADGDNIFAIGAYTLGLNITTVDAHNPATLNLISSTGFDNSDDHNSWQPSSRTISNRILYLSGNGDETYIVNTRSLEHTVVAGKVSGGRTSTVVGDYLLVATSDGIKVYSNLPVIDSP